MKKQFDIGKYRKEYKIHLGSVEKEVGTTVFKGGHNDLRKTSHKVQLNEEGKLVLNTHKTIITEGVKYPTQDEAEAIVDWTNKTNSIYFGGAGTEIRNAFNKCEKVRLQQWNRIFDDDSPWVAERKGSKLAVKWDKTKAERLGL